MNEPKRGGLGRLILMVIGLLVLLAIVYGGWKAVKARNSYSFVYLRSGELYVGKLSFFPKAQLRDAYILTVIRDQKDPKKTSFRLNPLKEAIWAPQTIYLNRDFIYYYGPIRENSKVVALLESAVKNGSNAAADQEEGATVQKESEKLKKGDSTKDEEKKDEVETDEKASDEEETKKK